MKKTIDVLALPSKMWLLIGGGLWFLMCVGFQAFLIKSVTHVINPVDVMVSTALMIIAFFFFYLLQKYSANYFNNIFTRIGFHAILIFKIVFLEEVLLKRMMGMNDFEKYFSDTIYIRAFTAFLVISYFSFVLWFVFHIRKLTDEARMRQTAENSLRDAELIKLRQQIQPHFLFNSLNSINALVVSQPTVARKMIQNLSDFLRGTLKKDENKPVLLSEEVDLLKLYLDIEKVRFGHRLHINFNVAEEALLKTAPPLLLQPIVENAIKFGLYNVLDDVNINVNAEVTNNMLRISVTNPFDEATATTRKGEGFGLSLIKRRLQLIYHRTDLLKTEKEGNIFKATILIPQI